MCMKRKYKNYYKNTWNFKDNKIFFRFIVTTTYKTYS